MKILSPVATLIENHYNFPMRILLSLILLTAMFLPATGSSADTPSLPGSIGSDPVLTMVGQPETWVPDNMYEHVNGEAELLKRYGAVSLAYVAYTSEGEDRLSVDILDMGVPVNAYGLYNLYAGCDGAQYSTAGATVFPGDYTSYALRGRYFMRIDVETGGGDEDGKPLAGAFLSGLSGVLPASEPLPVVAERLKKLARKPCEVSYHPEHVDYDLEAGPGYTWVGPDGGTYFIRFLGSPDEAEVTAAVLRDKGAPTVLVWGNAVTWPKVRTEGTASYLKMALKRVVKW